MCKRMNDLNRNVELMTLHFVTVPILVPFLFLFSNEFFFSFGCLCWPQFVMIFSGRSLIADAPSQKGKHFSRQLEFFLIFHFGECWQTIRWAFVAGKNMFYKEKKEVNRNWRQLFLRRRRRRCFAIRPRNRDKLLHIIWKHRISNRKNNALVAFSACGGPTTKS